MREYALHNAQQTEQLSGHGVLIQLWKNWKARREVKKLLEFDDHALRDIGVNRQDILRVLLLPPNSNIVAALNERRGMQYA